MRTTLPPGQNAVGPAAEMVGAAQVRLLTRVVALDEALPGVGSASFAVALAVFVIVPLAVAVTEIETLAPAPLASVPSAQVTVLLPLHVPCEVNEFTKLVPAGIGSPPRPELSTDQPGVESFHPTEGGMR